MADAKKWSYEQLKAGDTFVSLQMGTNRFATQAGMTGIGQPRLNIWKCKDLGIVEPVREGEGILRIQCGTNKYASQKGETPIGANRNQVARIHYRDDWEEKGASKRSEALLPKQAGDYQLASQAGQEVVIGKNRNTTPSIRGRMPRDPKSQGLIPFQSGTNVYASQGGMNDPPGVGMPRHILTDIESLNFTEEQLRKGAIYTPWFAGTNRFDSQKGTGGFLKVRDVLYKPKGGKEIPEDMVRQSDGIVVRQAGTNTLASQRGMTGFGQPRLNLYKPKFKKEWMEMWEEALKEWEVNRPASIHSPGTATPRTTRPPEAQEATIPEATKEEAEEEEEEEEEE